jgi:glycosyltransferase involved in cell wall biosynthesis
MTRIGLLTSSYPSAPGDPAGNFVAEHARWLRDQGHEVEVLAARPGQAIREPGLVVRRIPLGRRLFGAEGAPEVLARGGARADAIAVSAAMVAVALGRRRRWDRIIAHWLAPAGLAAAAVAGGRPVHAIAHSGDVHLLRRLGLIPMAAAALDRAGATLSFVSAHLRDVFLREVRPATLRARLELASSVTPMGVEVERFQMLRSPVEERDRPVAFLGRLVPIKGCDVAVAAAGLWQSPARLEIAGAGPGAASLRKLAAGLGSERIALRGEVRGRARDRFLAGAASLLLPSRMLPDGRTEGMPRVALEAMAAGVPLIASAVGGLIELPRDSVSLVPPNDPMALAAAVDRLLGDEAARRRQVSAASEFVTSRDWSAIGPRLW